MVFQIIYKQNLEKVPKVVLKPPEGGIVLLIERTFLSGDQGIVRIANSSIFRFYNDRSVFFRILY
jgi:hypothetical protein